jgi:hypothetical protein
LIGVIEKSTFDSIVCQRARLKLSIGRTKQNKTKKFLNLKLFSFHFFLTSNADFSHQYFKSDMSWNAGSIFFKLFLGRYAPWRAQMCSSVFLKKVFSKLGNFFL